MTAEQITDKVTKFLTSINPSEGRITVVLSMNAERGWVAVGRGLRKGHTSAGLTSAAHDSDPHTVATRLIADLN